ncbi:hypothetical protein N9951_01870 [Akkermansiaceae bacterium]|nr:hypothetical protein [Akkermansiaceae bacterium]
MSDPLAAPADVAAAPSNADVTSSGLASHHKRADSKAHRELRSSGNKPLGSKVKEDESENYPGEIDHGETMT